MIAEDAAVLHTGLVSTAYVTVNDTGARHGRDKLYTSYISNALFSVFRTTKTKSRLNFLSLLLGNYHDYVLNDAAFDYLLARKADPTLIARLRTHQPKRFTNQVPFLEYLVSNGVDIFDNNTVRMFGEAGLWGTIRYHGLMGNTVIVSDDAGQFRVGDHALCWVHAERLLQKLMPATLLQVRHVETLRKLIWLFYKLLKDFARSPSRRAAQALEVRFDRIFSIRTGYADLDKLLVRLLRRKHELLKVLERPEIPLQTNASENDLRSCVTKRKISGGTMSRDGRAARDTMLGLMKTCKKLGLSFWHYLGDRLGVPAQRPAIPELASLIIAKA